MMTVIGDIINEAERASTTYPPFNTPHEGYAVLLEEVDELWDEVKKKPSVRSTARMKEEAVQIAAMAVRFILDCCDETNSEYYFYHIETKQKNKKDRRE